LGNKLFIPKPPPLSMAMHVASIRQHFPSGRIVWNHKELSWRGELSPTTWSRTYTIELTYDRNNPPSVFVRDPDLKAIAGDRDLPHVYSIANQELCLYLPHGNFWTPAKPLGTTLLPWTCVWLWNFELWVVTGVWHAAGEHPPKAGDSR
jgi:hypothetical protein